MLKLGQLLDKTAVKSISKSEFTIVGVDSESRIDCWRRHPSFSFIFKQSKLIAWLYSCYLFVTPHIIHSQVCISVNEEGEAEVWNMYAADSIIHFWLESICSFDLIWESDEVVDLHFSFAAAWNQFPTLEEAESSDRTLMFICIVNDIRSVSAPYCYRAIEETTCKILFIRNRKSSYWNVTDILIYFCIFDDYLLGKEVVLLFCKFFRYFL